ncbi:TlpA family protein disulfide reductase [Anaerosacchariphilus polymeriproducens]|uniref:TlpA family protein disulfide reductase n=1 Tax=Anaerosacchariphilus polymeriproducens TaxID=1812858 RepID=A0A371AW06_9FIRM|nr:TlpA disulfide reductase family protein [Anaerosacchariphilus polymeriproducens]RDU23774.1 TlpA family protein disulfide reductase [Anaerosacchariphilus polymeriproducens]
MNKYLKLIILIVAMLVLIGGSTWAYKVFTNKYKEQDKWQISDNKETNGQTTDEKYKAPDFKVYDEDGNTVNLESKKGKPVVLNFWASWCPPCRSEMSDFQNVFDELGTEVEFMMINMTDGKKETQEKAISYIEEQGYTFPVYFDKKLEAANIYQVFSIPTTYFIDAEGNISTYTKRAIDEKTLRKAINLIQ